MNRNDEELDLQAEAERADRLQEEQNIPDAITCLEGLTAGLAALLATEPAQATREALACREADLGSCYLRVGRYHESIKRFRHGIELGCESGIVHYELVFCQ